MFLEKLLAGLRSNGIPFRSIVPLTLRALDQYLADDRERHSVVLCQSGDRLEIIRLQYNMMQCWLWDSRLAISFRRERSENDAGGHFQESADRPNRAGGRCVAAGELTARQTEQLGEELDLTQAKSLLNTLHELLAALPIDVRYQIEFHSECEQKWRGSAAKNT